MPVDAAASVEVLKRSSPGSGVVEGAVPVDAAGQVPGGKELLGRAQGQLPRQRLGRGELQLDAASTLEEFLRIRRGASLACPHSKAQKFSAEEAFSILQNDAKNQPKNRSIVVGVYCRKLKSASLCYSVVT